MSAQQVNGNTMETEKVMGAQQPDQRIEKEKRELEAMLKDINEQFSMSERRLRESVVKLQMSIKEKAIELRSKLKDQFAQKTAQVEELKAQLQSGSPYCIDHLPDLGSDCVLDLSALSSNIDQLELVFTPGISPAAMELKPPAIATGMELAVSLSSGLNADGTFWAMPEFSDEIHQALRRISILIRQEILTNGALLSSKAAGRQLKENDSVYVRYSKDNMWYRGIIEQVKKQGGCTVRMSDFGNSFSADDADVYLAPSDAFTKCSCQALMCSLYPSTAELSVPLDSRWLFNDKSKSAVAVKCSFIDKVSNSNGPCDVWYVDVVIDEKSSQQGPVIKCNLRELVIASAEKLSQGRGSIKCRDIRYTSDAEAKMVPTSTVDTTTISMTENMDNKNNNVAETCSSVDIVKNDNERVVSKTGEMEHAQSMEEKSNALSSEKILAPMNYYKLVPPPNMLPALSQGIGPDQMPKESPGSQELAELQVARPATHDLVQSTMQPVTHAVFSQQSRMESPLQTVLASLHDSGLGTMLHQPHAVVPMQVPNNAKLPGIVITTNTNRPLPPPSSLSSERSAKSPPSLLPGPIAIPQLPLQLNTPPCGAMSVRMNTSPPDGAMAGRINMPPFLPGRLPGHIETLLVDNGLLVTGDGTGMAHYEAPPQVINQTNRGDSFGMTPYVINQAKQGDPVSNFGGMQIENQGNQSDLISDFRLSNLQSNQTLPCHVTGEDDKDIFKQIPQFKSGLKGGEPMDDQRSFSGGGFFSNDRNMGSREGSPMFANASWKHPAMMPAQGYMSVQSELHAQCSTHGHSYISQTDSNRPYQNAKGMAASGNVRPNFNNANDATGFSQSFHTTAPRYGYGSYSRDHGGAVIYSYVGPPEIESVMHVDFSDGSCRYSLPATSFPLDVRGQFPEEFGDLPMSNQFQPPMHCPPLSSCGGFIQNGPISTAALELMQQYPAVVQSAETRLLPNFQPQSMTYSPAAKIQQEKVYSEERHASQPHFINVLNDCAATEYDASFVSSSASCVPFSQSYSNLGSANMQPQKNNDERCYDHTDSSTVDAYESRSYHSIAAQHHELMHPAVQQYVPPSPQSGDNSSPDHLGLSQQVPSSPELGELRPSQCLPVFPSYSIPHPGMQQSECAASDCRGAESQRQEMQEDVIACGVAEEGERDCRREYPRIGDEVCKYQGKIGGTIDSEGKFFIISLEVVKREEETWKRLMLELESVVARSISLTRDTLEVGQFVIVKPARGSVSRGKVLSKISAYKASVLDIDTGKVHTSNISSLFDCSTPLQGHSQYQAIECSIMTGRQCSLNQDSIKLFERLTANKNVTASVRDIQPMSKVPFVYLKTDAGDDVNQKIYSSCNKLDDISSSSSHSPIHLRQGQVYRPPSIPSSPVSDYGGNQVLGGNTGGLSEEQKDGAWNKSVEGNEQNSHEDRAAGWKKLGSRQHMRHAKANQKNSKKSSVSRTEIDSRNNRGMARSSQEDMSRHELDSSSVGENRRGHGGCYTCGSSDHLRRDCPTSPGKGLGRR